MGMARFIDNRADGAKEFFGVPRNELAMSWGRDDYEPPSGIAYAAPDGVLFEDRDRCKLYVKNRKVLQKDAGLQSKEWANIRKSKQENMAHWDKAKENAHEYAKRYRFRIDEKPMPSGPTAVRVNVVDLANKETPLLDWFPSTGSVRPRHPELKKAQYFVVTDFDADLFCMLLDKVAGVLGREAVGD